MQQQSLQDLPLSSTASFTSGSLPLKKVWQRTRPIRVAAFAAASWHSMQREVEFFGKLSTSPTTKRRPTSTAATRYGNLQRLILNAARSSSTQETNTLFRPMHTFAQP